jgi:hypothetical protein
MSKRARPSASEKNVDDKQRLLLDQLEEVASSIGIEVREERLMREVGYTVHSGPCRVNGRDVVLLDSNAELSELIEAMLDFLAGRDLDGVYIEPQLRELINGRAPKEPPSAEG